MTNGVLLDTSVASLLHPKRRGSPLGSLYEAELRNRLLVISFQTVAELHQWAEERRWSAARRAQLTRMLGQFVVIPYEGALAEVWAKVMTYSRRVGRRLESGDCWIAATALHRGLVLLTHDRDFQALQLPGLQIVCKA